MGLKVDERNITKTDLFDMGVEHAKNGKMLTPYECRDVDKILFNQVKKYSCRIKQAKWYSEMRGAFNKGWQKGNCDNVGLPSNHLVY